ncbi:MAG TPA: hypothetical protein VMP01_08320 [Pirellulaceae bacterium]|nr:hypothetical protein [Pirellulaceae bacterium]
MANGKAVKLIEFQRLPLKCDALAEATKRGIEITPDGGVIGLVRIHHWCGNDPVREHIARVNISEMLIFLGIGERVMNLPAEVNGLERDGGTISQFGWDVSEFNEIEFWQEVRQMNREQET